MFQVVGHHYRVVHYKSQRYGQPGQREKVYLDTGEIIQDSTYGQVGYHRKSYHRQVSETSAHHQYEEQKYGYRKSATEIYLVQFGVDVLGSVVG